jgi:hypothetical protein
MALALWLYQRRRISPAFATSEILSLYRVLVSYSFAVKPMPRCCVAGGFISSRIADKIAVMALSWCLSLPSNCSPPTPHSPASSMKWVAMLLETGHRL